MGSQTLAPQAQTFPQKAPNSPRSFRVMMRMVEEAVIAVAMVVVVAVAAAAVGGGGCGDNCNSKTRLAASPSSPAKLHNDQNKAPYKSKKLVPLLQHIMVTQYQLNLRPKAQTQAKDKCQVLSLRAKFQKLKLATVSLSYALNLPRHRSTLCPTYPLLGTVYPYVRVLERSWQPSPYLIPVPISCSCSFLFDSPLFLYTSIVNPQISSSHAQVGDVTLFTSDGQGCALAKDGALKCPVYWGNGTMVY